jgi:thiamine-monophosphate kinase
VSDGFLRDLGHLCESSRCGAAVDVDALPVARGASLEEALAGGEDYALLFAVRPERARRLLLRLPSSRRIGRFTEGSGIRLLEKGKALRLPPRLGFDHLAWTPTPS